MTGSIVLPVVASLNKLLKVDSEDAVYIANMKKVILDDFKARIAKYTEFFLFLPVS